MAQSKEDQFTRHTNLLRKEMEEGVWGEHIFILQNGFIVQSRLKQTFVTDTNGKDLIPQAEAEARAFEKKQKKQGYRFINVIDKDSDKGGDR
ncbi:hypothetical protein M0R19_04525 [Candidatus Pacearchaeota archaeon]|jgi:hypothetical protein|nr:hypothetical protein [Candidatus Pacearchaeota archaeon]